MGRNAVKIELSERQERVLRKYVNKRDISIQFLHRVQMILWAFEGKTNTEMVDFLKTEHNTIRKWRTRLA